MQLLRIKGTFRSYHLQLYFSQITTFFLNETSLSVEVRMCSTLPCILVLTLLSCANISVKYSSVETQNSH